MGISFSIEGPRAGMEETFSDYGEAESAPGERELALEALPEELRSAVKAVALEAPPDYGPWNPLVAGLPSLHRVTTLLGARATELLAREAFLRHADAQVSHVAGETASPPHDPLRWFETAGGGPALRAFYTAPAVLKALRAVTGAAWRPSGEGGTYSYYRREGHFLGIHLDVDECKLALITCFHEEGAPSEGHSGALELWPERAGEPLAAIEADPEPGRVTVRLRPGESIILLGGHAPHRFTPTGARHVRITAPLCYLPAN